MERLLLLVKYKTKPGTRKKFVDEVSELGIIKKIHCEDGCLSYKYYYDSENEDELLLVEEWQSKEQQQKHLMTKHMEKLKNIKEKYVIKTTVTQF